MSLFFIDKKRTSPSYARKITTLRYNEEYDLLESKKRNEEIIQDKVLECHHEQDAYLLIFLKPLWFSFPCDKSQLYLGVLQVVVLVGHYMVLIHPHDRDDLQESQMVWILSSFLCDRLQLPLM